MGATFKDFMHYFLQGYLDEWPQLVSFLSVRWSMRAQFYRKGLMFERCRQLQISLNLKKCVFAASYGTLLGHVICKEGMLVNRTKEISVILQLDDPKTQIEVKVFLGPGTTRGSSRTMRVEASKILEEEKKLPSSPCGTGREE